MSKNDRRNAKRMRALTKFANSIGLEGPVALKDQQLMRLKMQGRVSLVACKS